MILTEGGYSLFHYACSCGNFEIYDYIKSNMSNLSFLLFDKDNPTNETPLHWAVLKNNLRIV
jgi:ankyrin repeat protein